jgi:serine/threonine-protein kinase RsbW
LTNVRLHLTSRPENVAVAREALAGLAETLAFSREQYDDLRTAVTEACNNVVQHAYADGDGPLDIEIRVLQDAVEVTVRDAGVGLDRMAAEGGGELEIGLPVILALAERVELAHPHDGGTAVQMRFGVPGLAAPARTPTPAYEVEEGEPSSLFWKADTTNSGPPSRKETTALAATPGAEIVVPGFIAEARVSFSGPELAAAILPRVAAALAARAHFSADRVSDVQILSDSIAADAFRVLDGARLEVGLAIGRRELGMQVGPLLRGGAARIGLLDQLSSRHEATEIGPAEVLVLRLDDRG